MKNISKNRFLALVLCFTLVVSAFSVTSTSHASESMPETITVTLRVEDANKTLIPTTEVTLTSEDVLSLNETFNTSETPVLETGDVTAAHALAKYVSQTSEQPASDLTFSWNNPSHIPGQEALDTPDAMQYWSYRVNHTSPVAEDGFTLYSLTQCPIKNGDDVVLFRQNYSFTTGTSTSYLYFEKTADSTTTGANMSASIYKEETDPITYVTSVIPASGETITVEQDGHVVQTVFADEQGMTSLSFDTPGTYSLTAGTFPNTCRALSTITVTKASTAPTAAPTTPPTIAPTIVPTAAPNTTPKKSDTQKASAPKRVQATVKNKKVTLSWKKVSAATGYEIQVSKKNKKSFKKLTTTKKTKLVKKFKKGKYFVKVRSYVKSGSKKSYSGYSKMVSFRVKGVKKNN